MSNPNLNEITRALADLIVESDKTCFGDSLLDGPGPQIILEYHDFSDSDPPKPTKFVKIILQLVENE
jgi:hypothetical protein